LIEDEHHALLCQIEAINIFKVVETIEDFEQMSLSKMNAAFVAAIFALMMGLAMPAQAGGWGHGPSWGQAAKIVHQAGTDVSNGAKAVTKPPVPAIAAGAAVVGICAATAGACAVGF
jgi:hypothetical protein